ncbi:glycoside hydrolase family 31 protein [Millionella massiliensis]|uniref:glycoside hydrolase family 31 protein n=1 Tax=Millionella massiliensis TaxID=1871023 RepID=UPI0008DAAF63|nr:TIM-barrel domain-containing protein [Millionella massiliensis]
MKIKWMVCVAAFICGGSLMATAEQVRSWKQRGRVVEVTMTDGKLLVTPMARNAIRIQYLRSNAAATLPEFIFLSRQDSVPYRVAENGAVLEVATPALRACINREEGHIVFRDSTGRVLLAEQVDGRRVQSVDVQGEYGYGIEQRFESPADEYIFGTGQFQDGYLNIRGLTRRLTQLNTQISIPFILSSKGYGLLWHNYGLTYFNPADNKVILRNMQQAGESETVEVTTTEGTKREVRRANLFQGTLQVDEAGTYSLLMDVGQSMARKHQVRVDGQPIVEVNNIWLPRTTSFLIDLEAGSHDILVESEAGDKPEVFFRKVTDETVFRSPVADGIDYTVFSGRGDEAIATYRHLTGDAPMMPRWALGYVHCRERFKTQDELLGVAREFRKRELPVDLMVQDWMYWGRYGWNAMKFDEQNYPDPAAMVRELHDMDMRLMLSVWSKIDRTSEVGKGAADSSFYIPGTDWIDFFNSDAAGYYWRNFSQNLLKLGIDAWWQDATEPENDDLMGRRVNGGRWPGEKVRNVYPLFVCRTVYEGSRRDTPEKRTMILTRSGFSGMQRYAAATWSGDVGYDWETLRRQIAGGLNYMASGLPWWTYDAGGFFRPGGQYDDPAYHECFLRWFQTATFLPLQRVHGFGTDTEFWNFGDTVTQVANRYLDFRYRMLPYTYSEAAAITFRGSTLMRPFVMDFAEDEQALRCRYSYMFGPALLVAPVVEPNVTQWAVYLPKPAAGWYDFWTGERLGAGQTVEVPVTEAKIPIFVKAGSILPLGEPKQSTAERPDDAWEIRIYPGADAHYTIYEDEGTNYNYEEGHYATYDLSWDDDKQVLTISDRSGSFDGMVAKRKLNLVKVGTGKGVGMEQGTVDRTVTYSGRAMRVRL